MIDSYIRAGDSPLTPQQQKIVWYLIFNVKPEDEPHKIYSFDIRRFCILCGISYKNGKNYIDLKSAIVKLSQKDICTTLVNGAETGIRFIEKVQIEKENGIVDVQLSRDVQAYFLRLKRHFNTYDLLCILKMESNYSIRLYEYIKSIHTDKKGTLVVTYKVDDIRAALKADNYKIWQDFKKRVLDKAITEINEYSDKQIEYTPIKQGRAVFAVQMTIKSKGKKEQALIKKEWEQRIDARGVLYRDDVVIESIFGNS